LVALPVLTLALPPCAAAEASAGAATVIDHFRFATPALAAETWQPRERSPAPAPQSPGGCRFPVPFARNVDRVYWDRDVRLDLSGFTRFVLDATVDRPEALRHLGLYFKSGDGWYVCNVASQRRGRQEIVFPKGAYTVEGRPAGWDRIEAVRLSPWKGARVDAQLTAHALRAVTDTVLLLQASESAPDAAERRYARSVTARTSRWLADQGIAHAVLTEEQLRPSILSNTRLLLLCYNPYPTRRQMGLFRNFIERGGKLVVFYSASEKLARLMRLRLGPYKQAKEEGQWSAFAFLGPDEWDVPPRVRQHSSNIRPVYPADETARVIARWENARGEFTGDPAWVASRHGLWMTHVLLEGDKQNKQHMLLGLLGAHDESIWAQASRHAIQASARMATHPDFGSTIRYIAERAPGNSSRARIDLLVHRARALREHARASHRRGRYRAAIAQADSLYRTLLEAYARAHRPRPAEFRGVWAHDGTGWFPGDWERTCRILAEHGVTAVFPNVLWGGLAHYPSDVLPRSTTFRKYGDQLEQCVKAARKHGLEVHVWHVGWSLQGAPESFVERMRREGRLQVTAEGQTKEWLSPAHPANVSLAIDSLAEVATRYDIDGIHLDYVRYAGSDVCYSAQSRKRFEAWLGEKVGDWPETARPGGTRYQAYRRFRTDQINLFVRGIHRQVKPLRPGLRISAAVFKNYPDCISTVGQDWAHWLREGYVDFVSPMTYTAESQTFERLTRSHLALAGAGDRVYPGLGVTANESDLRPDQVIDQIARLRRLGAAGFMLFDLSHTLRDETLPVLRWGVTAPTTN